jgi:hypothetical protein
MQQEKVVPGLRDCVVCGCSNHQYAALDLMLIPLRGIVKVEFKSERLHKV